MSDALLLWTGEGKEGSAPSQIPSQPDNDKAVPIKDAHKHTQQKSGPQVPDLTEILGVEETRTVVSGSKGQEPVPDQPDVVIKDGLTAEKQGAADSLAKSSDAMAAILKEVNSATKEWGSMNEQTAHLLEQLAKQTRLGGDLLQKMSELRLLLVAQSGETKGK